MPQQNELRDYGLMALIIILVFLFFGGMEIGGLILKYEENKAKRNQPLVDKILEKVDSK